jgi:hypothetical protein
VYTIQRHVDSDAAWRSYFQAAKKCHGQITSYAREKDSFAQRYSIVLEELRTEAIKQNEHQSTVNLNKSENEVESDHDAEVARTILRLSDNNHMDSYVSPRGGQYRNANATSSTGGITQSQTHLPPNYNSFENFHQILPPEHGSMQFVRNIDGSTPATFTGEATGWGDFDSFVSSRSHSSYVAVIEFLLHSVLTSLMSRSQLGLVFKKHHILSKQTRLTALNNGIPRDLILGCIAAMGFDATSLYVYNLKSQRPAYHL